MTREPERKDEAADAGGYESRTDFAWPLADAKARFSELIDTVEREGPQVISRRGKEVAVVVPMVEWRKKTQRKGSLAEFLAESPLNGAEEYGLVIERERSDPHHREVQL